MAIAETASQHRFRVIDGAGQALPSRPESAAPDAPSFSVSELAAEMAEIFALSLLRKRSLGDLQDPHCAIRIDGATRFTLHEMLCELRCLPWFDSSRALPDDASDPEAAQRRALRWNRDGQLTLRTLFRCGVALRGAPAELSSFWRGDFAVARPDPVRRPPKAEAPMSDWINWCSRHSGAGLRLPGENVAKLRVGSLEDMAEDLHGLPPSRPFHNAALSALARGAALDEGLDLARTCWPATRLLALMAKAEARAARVVLMQTLARDRLPRPAVTAARMTVWLAREERMQDPACATYRAAADELAEAAPNLLYWMNRANSKLRRGRQRFDNSLFLPLAEQDRFALSPSDLATHVAVAGALATVLKAVFDTSRRTQLQMVGASGPDLSLSDEVDRMVANVALARVVSGGYHPAENHQQMRLGQSIALQVLREAMEEDNRSTSASFHDFDGRLMKIEAHPRHFRRGFAELRADGTAVPWPQETAPAAAHLTRVV